MSDTGTSDTGTSDTDPSGTGTGRDLTTERHAYDPAGEVPSAGSGRMGPPDPHERGAAALGNVERLEEDSAFHGAGAPSDLEAPDAAPFSSSLYPASSDATGLTHPGDAVTGVEDGPHD